MKQGMIGACTALAAVLMYGVVALNGRVTPRI